MNPASSSSWNLARSSSVKPAVRLGILEVYLLVCHVQVSADDDGLPCVELLEVCAEVVLPRHAVVQSAQLVLRVGGVDRHEEELVHLQCDDAPLVVMLVDAQSVGHVERGVAGEDGCPGVSLLLGIVPVGRVSVEREVQLSLLHLGLLQAEEVGVQCQEGVSEAFVATGTQPVDVP